MLRPSFVRSVLPALLLVGVAVSGVSAQVEPIIPSEVYRLRTQPTGANLQAIRTYCEFWSEQMGLAQTDDEVANARRKLADPLKNATATDIFKTQYSPLCAIAMKAKRLPNHKKPVVRMNTLIIAGRLTDGVGVDLAHGLLKDKEFAVRYWAAAALAQVTAGQLPDGKVTEVIDAIERVVLTERDYLVRGQLYQALNHIGDVNINDAGDENIRGVTVLVGAMEGWAAVYAGLGLADSVDAEAHAFAKLHRNIIYLWLAQRDKMEQPVKAYARMSGKYVRLTAELLSDQSDERVKAICFDLVKHCETAMLYGLRKFDPPGWPEDRKSPALSGALSSDDLLKFKDAMYQWVGGATDGLLTTEKIGIPRNELDLKITAKPSAANN